MEGGKTILDPDWVEPGEEKVEVGVKPLDDGKNPRLIVRMNVPAGHAFGDVVQVPGMPPMVLVAVRADADVLALGLLEKLKIMVHQVQVKINKKASLTEGVAEAAGLDLTKLRKPS